MKHMSPSVAASAVLTALSLATAVVTAVLPGLLVAVVTRDTLQSFRWWGFTGAGVLFIAAILSWVMRDSKPAVTASVDRLGALRVLLDEGLLTPEEYQRKRAKLMGAERQTRE